VQTFQQVTVKLVPFVDHTESRTPPRWAIDRPKSAKSNPIRSMGFVLRRCAQPFLETGM